MAKLAILIPSRNERYLTPTVEDCFAKAQGEVEVVVTLEGYWPSDWKTLTDKYPNLHTVHHGSPQGMRPAINAAAASAISRGAKWLMKLDAHCLLDEAYDTKLLADIEPNWIVIPRRKRLDAENWVIQDVGKPDIDYHYLSYPDDPNDFGGPGLNGKVWVERIVERLNKPEFDIDDEMSSQGSCWLTSAQNFIALDLMDTATFGPFWCEAQEVLMKAWLSGGRCVVNKKTYYAHLHKGKSYRGTDGTKGRGYKLDEKWLQQGRNAAMGWLHNNVWPKQTLPFKWLIEKFSPVPGWPEDWEEKVYGTSKGTIAMAGVSTGDNSGLDTSGARSSLKIHSARYGILGAPMPFRDHSVDVAETVRSLVKDATLDIVVNNSTLTPGQNPYRGKKKVLLLTYSYDGGELITVERLEKEWLIIGQVQKLERGTVKNGLLIGDMEPATIHVELPSRQPDDIIVVPQLPHTATALNDFLIRKFQISERRLRGPMPIELRDFHRDDLAKLYTELGFTKGAEIGVAEGHYSEVLLKANPDLELFLVDPWRRYDGNPWSHSQEHQDFSFNETRRKTAGYNVKFMQDFSMNAVREVAENSLDFAYIDGHHGFDWVMQDLIEWSKRVRSGGIVSGDDYYHFKRHWAGVVEAVNAYTQAHQVGLWFLCDAPRSVDFFWVKP